MEHAPGGASQGPGTASLVTDWAKGGTNVDDQFGTAATIDVEAVETVDGVMRGGPAPRAAPRVHHED